MGRIEGNFCLRCNNLHGCRTEKALCLCLERNESERGLRGTVLMAQRGLLAECKKCAQFRQCWTGSAYRKAVRSGL